MLKNLRKCFVMLKNLLEETYKQQKNTFQKSAKLLTKIKYLLEKNLSFKKKCLQNINCNHCACTFVGC